MTSPLKMPGPTQSGLRCFAFQGQQRFFRTLIPFSLLPSFNKQTTLFPLPYFGPTSISKLKSARRRQHFARWQHRLATANDCVRALNALWQGKHVPSNTPHLTLVFVADISAAQEQAMINILTQVLLFGTAPLDFRRVSGPKEAGSLPQANDYQSFFPEAWRPLTATNVALPPMGKAASVPMLPLLPPHLAAMYSNIDHLLLPDVDWDMVRNTRPVLGVVPGEYPPIVRRMMAGAQVRILEASEVKVINGIFGVAKGAQARLVFDGHMLSHVFVSPPDLDLAGASVFGDLIVPPDDSLFFSKRDLEAYFHVISVTDDLVPYFALPRVWSMDIGVTGPPRWVHPALLSLPMGWNHSPNIAQAINALLCLRCPSLQSALRLKGTPKDDLVLAASKPLRYVVYYDDVNIVGTHDVSVRRAADELDLEYDAAGFPVKHSKTVNPSPPGCEVS
jgi:hypothetical protein